ncbi:MAG: ABC transporter permease [Actinomycetota bacterium]
MATTDPGLLAPAPASSSLEAPGQVEGRTPWQLLWMRFKQDRAALVGFGFVIFLTFVALFAAPIFSHFIVHHGINQSFRSTMLDAYGLPKGPNSKFWFGADINGRDVFIRTLYGTRTSLLVGVIATGIAMVIGVFLGTLAGYFRGWVDTLISRAMEIVLAMPILIFALGISAACSLTKEGCLGGFIQPGLPLVIAIIALFSWASIGRIVRGQTLSVREREFIEAARSIGSSHGRIMFKETLPNLVAPIIVYGTLLIPANILFEAYLSYLGLGVPPTTASWGQMISDSTVNGVEASWWMILFPGIFLVLTTLAFNLMGDGMRDALDPSSDRV